MKADKKQAIAQSLEVVKTLASDDAPDSIAVLHLGHPSDAKYGTIEEMTPAEYEKFVWLNTWPKPTLAARRAIEASEAARMRGRR